jgi:hypothetical protein
MWLKILTVLSNCLDDALQELVVVDDVEKVEGVEISLKDCPRD